MANTIPPMLSATPPPMDDDAMDENDDEDFGDYSTANLNYNSAATSEPIYNDAAWEDGTFECAVQKCEDLSDFPNVSTASSEHDAMSGSEVCVDSVATPPIQDDQNAVSACQSDRSEDLNTIQLQSKPLPDGISHTSTCRNKTSSSFKDLDQKASETVSEVGCESDCPDHMSRSQSVSPNAMCFEDSLPEWSAAVSRVSSGPGVESSAPDFTFPTDYSCVSDDNGFKTQLPVGVGSTSVSEECEERSANAGLDDDLNAELHSENNIFPEGFQDFDKFEEFATFQDEVATKVIVATEEGQNHSESEHENVVSLTDSEFGFPSDDEDEFCEFASSSVSLSVVSASVCVPSTLSLATLPLASPDADGDSFATFQTASPWTSRVEDTNQVLEADGENVVTAVFPACVTCAVPVFTSEQSSAEDTTVWTSLRDVDASNALTYQWINSTANKMLLAALGIDTRNILFVPKWGVNVNVPRFAANLSVSPLQPVPASSPATPLTLTTDATHPKSPAKLQATLLTPHSEVVVPDAQFDWTSSGLVNPLDCFEKVERSVPPQDQGITNSGQWLSTVASEEGISAEAASFIDQLSDISFVRSKTLVVLSYRPMLLHS